MLFRSVPEKKEVKLGEVCFIRLRYADAKGTVKPLERGVLTVTVQGGELLAVGNACPFNVLGYNGTQTDTYYGEAMAVVKATAEKLTLTATDGKLSGITEITVK